MGFLLFSKARIHSNKMFKIGNAEAIHGRDMSNLQNGIHNTKHYAFWRKKVQVKMEGFFCERKCES